MTKAKTRMVIVEMEREQQFLHPLLKLKSCNHGYDPFGAKCMTDSGGIVLMKSTILAPRTAPRMSGRGSRWYGTTVAVSDGSLNK